MGSERVGLVAEAEAVYGRVVSDPVRYAEHAANIVHRARLADDIESVVIGLRAQAWARHAVLDNGGARRLLDGAVRLADAAGLRERLGEVLLVRAICWQELGRYDAARRDLAAAEELLPVAQRPALLMQRAVLEHNTGRLAHAVELYLRVLDEPDCPPEVWAKSANNLSVAQTQLGNPGLALQYLDRAAVLAAGLSHLLAHIGSSRAWATFHAGRPVESLRQFDQVGLLYAGIGVPRGEHLLEYADVLVDLRLLDEALAASLRAAAEFESHAAGLMAAEARLRCSRLELAVGDAAAARRDAEIALRLLRRQRRTAWVARATIAAVEAETADSGYRPAAVRDLRRAAATLQRLGLRANAVEAHLAAGRAGLAVGRHRPALENLQAAGRLARGQALLVRLRGQLALTLAAHASGRREAALRHCRVALRDLDHHRAALPSVELRVLASGHGEELGLLGLQALLSGTVAGSNTGASGPRILDWLERTRAASLLRAAPPVAGAAPEVAALHALQQELRQGRRDTGSEPIGLLTRQRALEDEIRRQEDRIRRQAWTTDADAEDDVRRAVTASELRGLLAGDWLVEYAALDDELIAVLVTPRTTRVIRLGPLAPIRTEVDAVLFALRRLLRGGRFAGQAKLAASQATGRLSKLLLEPLGVPPDAGLVVVPSARLHRVPWSALRTAAVSVAPSATFWARSRRAAQRAATRTVFAERLAVTLVAGPDLPGAVAEVAALSTRYPDATVLGPGHSTVAATLAAMTGADLAHLACHGRLRSDSPLFSALELSDGALTLHELLEQGVAPRRVVLAACDSGVQRSYAGEEVLGFVSVLMASGTSGLVASIVAIPDGASIPLMTALHDALTDGQSLATALAQARQQLEPQRPEEFAAWCALNAYGAG